MANGYVDLGTDKYEEWVSISTTGHRPSPRYKHAAAVIDGDRLYISGGSRSGRNLSDFQVLDLKRGTWSALNPTSHTDAAFPATSGHHMIFWGGRLLIIQGKSNHSPFLTVRFFDISTNQCGLLQTTGDIPVARQGQSVTTLGSKLFVFGGEDTNRKLMNDLHVLHLQTMSWEKLYANQPSPSPRYDHAVAVHGQCYLLLFGGCSHTTCFNDFWVLDLNSMEWSQPETGGDYVTPRAGHSGVTINEHWYIVGGGDVKGGAIETLVLDMTKLIWSVVASTSPRDPLASEGISICSATINGETYLVAFGGYNGKYNNEVFVMRPKWKDSVRPIIYQSPAAAAAAASVSAAYSIDSGKHLNFTKLLQHSELADSERLEDAKRLLGSSLTEVRGENSILKGKIDYLNGTYAEFGKELLSVKDQLTTERERRVGLEVQIGKFQDHLKHLPSVECQLQSLRKEISSLEQQHGVNDGKTIRIGGSGSVWQWFSGNGSSP